MEHKREDRIYNLVLSPFHRGLIDEMVKTGRFKTGAQFVREAIRRYAKEVMDECA